MLIFKAIKQATVIIFLISFPAAYATTFAERTEVKEFISHMVEKHNFNKSELEILFNKYETSEKVIALMNKPFEALSWTTYRKHFLSKSRIQGGIDFLNKHRAILQQAEDKYGVPAEIIVAIIGAETSYGKFTGTYPPIQTLATLAFDYPRRAKFFTQELEHFLLLTREQKLDPTKIKGSYSGALGIAQFMPSSYRNYAIDFSNSGKADLVNDAADAIGSIANYFKKHGWKTNEDIVHKATFSNNKYHLIDPELLKSSPKPTLSIRALVDYHIQPEGNIKNSDDRSFAILPLDIGKGSPELWLGEKNFYVITRYNKSTNYAMAIYQLSQEIKKRVLDLS